MKREGKPMNTRKVYEAVCETLRNIPLGEYENEEKQLQPYLQTEISKLLEAESLDEYQVKISIGGRNKPKVDLLGTNFWPDIVKRGTSICKSVNTPTVKAAFSECKCFKILYFLIIMSYH